jgi:hypothetical protein
MSAKKVLTLSGLTAALMAATMAAAPMASASGGVSNPTGGAYVEFVSYGERFTVTDTLADGHSAVGDLYWRDGQGTWHHYDTLWNSKGAGASVTRNYALPEDLTIAYRACIGEAGTGQVFKCGDWYVDKA